MAKILLIEDDKMTAAMVEKFLTGGGHEVTVAHDGGAGLKAVAAAQPDVVITDLFMPDTDGLEAIRTLRAQKPDLPIVAVSGGMGGGAGMEVLTMAKLLGAKEVLRKPLSARDVLGAVARCLSGG